jgi:hypothetical protein
LRLLILVVAPRSPFSPSRSGQERGKMADGLFSTNHHVAFGAVQAASASDNDYLRNGFLARTRAEEIQARARRSRRRELRLHLRGDDQRLSLERGLQPVDRRGRPLRPLGRAEIFQSRSAP